MFTFETSLKMIKHEVLKQITLLAINDKLTTENIFDIHELIVDKRVPKYRCCVYKERAIVNERAKLAANFKPDSNFTKLDEFNDDFGQIMYILAAACDRCPINKYTVTESCRGCLTHKCMEVCPANAMMKVAGKAYINQELCKECGACKKACPYNAISEVRRPCWIDCPTGALSVREDDRRAIIKEDDCIQCGACMKACPWGAISDRSYIVSVAKELTAKKNDLVAIVAPAISGQFGSDISLGKIKSALLKMGFSNMNEVSCGADIVTMHESKEFVERIKSGEGYMINSCCPALYSYIEKEFPGQVSKISTTVSPMIASARIIKEANPDAKVVFIGPCTAKKTELNRPEVKGAVDYVLTFEEICAMFEAYNINFDECEDLDVNEGSKFGRGFAMSGGLSLSIANYIKSEGIDIEFKPLKVSGKDEIRKTLLLAKVGRLPGNFIEGMMCSGGCINGAGTFITSPATKGDFIKEENAAKIKNVADNKSATCICNINMER